MLGIVNVLLFAHEVGVPRRILRKIGLFHCVGGRFI